MAGEIFRLTTAHRMQRRAHPPVGSMSEYLIGQAARMGILVYSPPRPGEIADEHPVMAEVNTVEGPAGWFESRWIARCAVPLYRGRERGDEPCDRALVVDPGDPVFACPPGCAFGDEIADGKWRRVEFPDALDALEAILLERHPADRWTAPGQTAADLARENVEHGDPLPDGYEL